MEKGEKIAFLSRAFDLHADQIHETFQMMERPVDRGLEKVDWSEVIKLGSEISKQTTVAGMLWNGEEQDVKDLESNMDVYFNVLHGFILLCARSSAGAGPTLHASIHASAKKVIDSSLLFFKEAILSQESKTSRRKDCIPQLSGSVWEACEALKKTPSINSIAIGREITLVAVATKDVLREIKELKSGNGDEGDGSSEDDLGNDLSTEELEVAKFTIQVVSDSLDFLKKIIRYVSGVEKSSGEESPAGVSTAALERLLRYCQDLGSEVNELGVCVYPPQEIPQIELCVVKMRNAIGSIWSDVEEIGAPPPEGFGTAFKGLECSLGKLQSLVGGMVDGLVPEMVKLAL